MSTQSIAKGNSQPKALPSRIKLDVGGQHFSTSLSTLTRFPATMIGAMFSGKHTLEFDEKGNVLIDRDGTHFRYILNFLRAPDNFTVNDVSAANTSELKKEIEFYGLEERMSKFFPETVFIENYFGFLRARITITFDSRSCMWKVSTSSQNVSGQAMPATVADCCRGCGCVYIRNPDGYMLGAKKFFNKDRKIHNPEQPQPDPGHCPVCEGAECDLGLLTSF